MTDFKLLTVDIENFPNVAHVWQLFNQNVSLAQLQIPASTVSFAAKWYGNSKVLYYSDFHNGHDEMVLAAHRLFDEASCVMGYNSKGFDTKHLNWQFTLAGLTPPSPYAQIDLYQVIKQNFKPSSGKLDFVAGALGIGHKTAHSGHQLWVDCMAGDEKAWAKFRSYNKNDVVLTEALYDRLRPWIKNHPHMGLYGDTVEEHVCSTCGSANVRKRGFAYTAVGRYQQWQCERAECGRYSRGKKLLDSVDLRGTS